MADMRTHDQLLAILDLIEHLGLDNVAAHHRISAIVGRPVPSTWGTLTTDEAARVIVDLGRDTLQPTLPYDIPQEQRR